MRTLVKDLFGKMAARQDAPLETAIPALRPTLFILTALIEKVTIRRVGAPTEQASPHDDHPSRRACPQCGSPMVYRPTRWFALTSKHLRSCKGCSYTDSRSVKLVRQI